MTQQQLADKVGVTRQTIVALEKGNYSPSLELGFRIAQAFKVSFGRGIFLWGEQRESFFDDRPVKENRITSDGEIYCMVTS
jgi:putative transcriptional regulator